MHRARRGKITIGTAILWILFNLFSQRSGFLTLQANGVSQTTPAVLIIPDSELVNSPTASNFDIAAYVESQPGYIKRYSETVSGRHMSGIDTVQFIATNTSVNPRLLLALIEYRAGWLTNANPSPDAVRYPAGLHDESRSGLFAQLVWAANVLNDGYYGWKQRGLTTLQFNNQTSLRVAPELNAGTVAIQFLFAQTAAEPTSWTADVMPWGFQAAYTRLFGDPFKSAVEPLAPPDLEQPELALPFPKGVMWYFTAGPHGGWGRTTSGWSAVDFAPPRPRDLPASRRCYVSSYLATAVVGGVIARSGDGAVVIDVDGDGDERTGWTILYLHIADADRVKVETIVQPGDPIGHPSCEGFYLNTPGTHLHIARRYNGEWIPADCWACRPDAAAPRFVMSGWTMRGYPKLASFGWMEKDGQVRRMINGRNPWINGVIW
jgi:LasA protease